MPPSILSSEALVIWMFRIAMNAPIMAANTAIQVPTLARSLLAGEAAAMLGATRCAGAEAERARLDMASPLGNAIGGFWRRLHRRLGRRSLIRRDRRLRSCRNGRDHGHAGTQIDRRVVERDLHGDALHHLGEIAGGVVRSDERR